MDEVFTTWALDWQILFQREENADEIIICVSGKPVSSLYLG